MTGQIKFFALGLIAAGILGAGAIAGFLFLGTGDHTMTVHSQRLPSGKCIQVTRCTLAWGVEHGERLLEKDCFLLEYVMSSPDFDLQARNLEAMEVFELIRPISELWKLDKAELCAFPTIKRKGIYYIYSLKRNADGTWGYEQHSAKVHLNDQ